MRLFVDASAIVAIVGGEPEQRAFAGVIQDADRPLWSAMVCWEAVSALRRSYNLSVEQAQTDVEQAADRLSLEMVLIGAPELAVALDAFRQFGKGRHPAKLNFGDCFAYACAKTNHARLLYKGDDFSRTDLR